jgi:hypothetical protein
MFPVMAAPFQEGSMTIIPQPGVMAQEMTLPVNVTTSIRNFVTCIIIEVTNAKM